MTKEEFENLYGKKVQVGEFEVINAMYMLDENETKQQFVERFKKMNAAVMLANFADVLSNLRERHAEELAAMSDKDSKTLNEIRQHEKDLEGTVDRLNHMLAEANRKHNEFASTIAVSAHSYDNESICKACVAELGVKQYYRTLQAYDCTPNKADLDIFVEATNE